MDIRVALEEIDEALGAAKAVKPVPRPRGMGDRRMMNDDHDGLPATGPIVDARLQRIGCPAGEMASGPCDVLMTRDVQRQQKYPCPLDNTSVGAGRGAPEQRQRPIERARPRIGSRVGVMIARHERHAIGIDPRIEKGLGEGLELLRGAQLGEVARDDEVAGARIPRGTEPRDQLIDALLRIERSAEAGEAHSQLEDGTRLRGPCTEHV